MRSSYKKKLTWSVALAAEVEPPSRRRNVSRAPYRWRCSMVEHHSGRKCLRMLAAHRHSPTPKYSIKVFIYSI